MYTHSISGASKNVDEGNGVQEGVAGENVPNNDL